MGYIVISEIYLDNAATTKPSETCVKAMCNALQAQYYNPSALYKPALDVQKQLAETKQLLAERFGVNKNNVLFTCGGTDANNCAIFSYAHKCKAGDVVLYTKIEHPSVAEACKALAQREIIVQEIAVNSDGTVDTEQFKTQLNDKVKLICIMHVNNELGTIQNIESICNIRDTLAPNAAIHIDGVQAFLKVPFSFKKYNVQSYSFSAHKIHGPKGLGVLVYSKNIHIMPYRFGGGQELGIISGTENTPAILGLRAVMLEESNEIDSVFEKKVYFLEKLCQNIPSLKIIGPDPHNKEMAAPHILNISFPPLRSDVLINALSQENIYCSSGSACSSQKQKLSSVLQAIHTPRNIAESAVRFSLSKYTTLEELDIAVNTIYNIYTKFAKFVRR